MTFDPTARPRVVPRLARLVTSIFFRDVEILGGEGLPPARALVLVANHPNGLMDPALLIGHLAPTTRFLAKSTLWEHPVVRPFLDLAAAIPVFRRQDPGVDTKRNEQTFEACFDVLGVGGTIAIFPEGISHTEPALMPLRSGVGRIVLGALERTPDLDIRIVPIGLTYEEKGRFRSRVLLDVGRPLDPSPWLKGWHEDPRAAARELTERVHESLAAVTLNFPSWEEARWVQRAVELYARPDVALPAGTPLASRYELQQAFAEGYLELKRRFPDLVEGVVGLVRDYDAELRRWKIDDVQVAASYPWSGVVRFAVLSLWKLLVRTPLGGVGIVLHSPAWFFVRFLSARLGTSPDVVSTVKMFASLVAFPVTWASLAIGLGLYFGPLGVLGGLVGGPLTGWQGLALHERRLHVRHQARAFFLLRRRRASIAGLREKRQRLSRAVSDLVEIWRVEQVDQASSPAQ